MSYSIFSETTFVSLKKIDKKEFRVYKALLFGEITKNKNNKQCIKIAYKPEGWGVYMKCCLSHRSIIVNEGRQKLIMK